MDLISCVLHFFLRMKKLHQLSCNVVYLVFSVVWCTQNYHVTKLMSILLLYVNKITV